MHGTSRLLQAQIIVVPFIFNEVDLNIENFSRINTLKKLMTLNYISYSLRRFTSRPKNYMTNTSIIYTKGLVLCCVFVAWLILPIFFLITSLVPKSVIKDIGNRIIRNATLYT